MGQQRAGGHGMGDVKGVGTGHAAEPQQPLWASPLQMRTTPTPMRTCSSVGHGAGTQSQVSCDRAGGWKGTCPPPRPPGLLRGNPCGPSLSCLGTPGLWCLWASEQSVAQPVSRETSWESVCCPGLAAGGRPPALFLSHRWRGLRGLSELSIHPPMAQVHAGSG